MIGVNPALSVTLPKFSKPEMKIINAADLRRFARAALEEKRLGALFVLAVSTGMRPEVYLGLAWSDLSSDFRQLTIQRVLVRTNLSVAESEERWWFEEPKTKKSRRTLALESEMADLRRQHQEQQFQEKREAGDCYEDHGLVFATRLG